jgi:hypothetical protein
MSFTYNPPTGLTGSASGLNVGLSWNVPTLISSPSLLLHMDGSNGSTTFVDSSGVGNIITVNGTAAVSTTNPKFGTGCLSGLATTFGDTNYLTTPISASGPLDLSTGDFTIEFWFYLNSFSGPTQVAISSGFTAGTGYELTIENGGSTGNVVARFGTGVISTDATSVPFNTWSYITFVRQGTTFGIWRDGVSLGTPATLAGNIGTGSTLTIGGVPGGGNQTHGQIDELRITKGTSFYTPGTNFSPPTGPFGIPFGYDIYRNGVSVATFAGGPAYIDTVPAGGIYTYNVAAWDNTADSSDLSAPLILNVSATVVKVYGKFAPAAAYPPALLINAKGIKPRVYMPKENVTVKT